MHQMTASESFDPSKWPNDKQKYIVLCFFSLTPQQIPLAHQMHVLLVIYNNDTSTSNRRDRHHYEIVTHRQSQMLSFVKLLNAEMKNENEKIAIRKRNS